jgi:hypothetical protein
MYSFAIASFSVLLVPKQSHTEGLCAAPHRCYQKTNVADVCG